MSLCSRREKGVRRAHGVGGGHAQPHHRLPQRGAKGAFSVVSSPSWLSLARRLTLAAHPHHPGMRLLELCLARAGMGCSMRSSSVTDSTHVSPLPCAAGHAGRVPGKRWVNGRAHKSGAPSAATALYVMVNPGSAPLHVWLQQQRNEVLALSMHTSRDCAGAAGHRAEGGGPHNAAGRAAIDVHDR